MFRWMIAMPPGVGDTVPAHSFGIEAELYAAIKAGRIALARIYSRGELRLYVQHDNGTAVDVTPDAVNAEKSGYE